MQCRTQHAPEHLDKAHHTEAHHTTPHHTTPVGMLVGQVELIPCPCSCHHSGENSSDTADSSILAFAGGNGNLDMECISPCAKRPRVTDVCFDSPVSSPSPSGSCSPVCTPRSSLDSPGSDVSAFTPAGVGSSPLSRDTSSIFTDAKPTTYERHIPQPVLAARPRPEATPTVELPGSSLPLSGSSLEAEVISFVRVRGCTQSFDWQTVHRLFSVN